MHGKGGNCIKNTDSCLFFDVVNYVNSIDFNVVAYHT